MPRVSVIVPSYNHEKYVAEAVRSVFEQTYQDFEIVITDDGSTDGTVAEVKKFNDPRIRLYTFGSNRGAAVASTNCLREAGGEFIAMLSSDDVFMPDKLEKQVKFLDGHPDVWAVFGYAHVIDDDGNDLDDENHFYNGLFVQPNRTRHEWLNHFFYKGNCLCHPSVLARREVYTGLGPPDPRYAQMGDFYRWIRTCLKHEIYVMPEELIKFRVRAGESNASGKKPVVLRRGRLEFMRLLGYYLEIGSAQELLKIFPDAEKYGRAEDDLIPYFIARLAIDNENFMPLAQIFGINVMYDVLGDKKVAERLEKDYGFTYRDFIELTGKYDCFNIETVMEQDDNIRKLHSELACLSTGRGSLKNACAKALERLPGWGRSNRAQG